MTEVLAKGVNFLYAKRFIEAEYGSETWNKLLTTMPSEAREIWEGAVLAHKSYPFGAFKEMMRVLSAELQATTGEQLARIYEFIADQSLNKVYKIFFSFTNPVFVIKNYPKLWANFFNSGNVEVTVAEKGHAVLKFTVPEIFLDWLNPACLGYSRKAVEMAGGSGLSITETARQKLVRNSWEISFELTWKEKEI